jgi:hypothetical protein
LFVPERLNIAADADALRGLSEFTRGCKRERGSERGHVHDIEFVDI